MKSFFQGLKKVFFSIVAWFPFTRAGRQTFIYLMIGLCGPALTILGWWAMETVRDFPGTTGTERLEVYARLATMVMVGLLVIIVALSCFVSIRAIKIGAGGIEAKGRGGEDHYDSDPPIIP